MGSTHPHAPRGEALRSQDCRDRRAPPSGLPADVSLGLAIAMADTMTYLCGGDIDACNCERRHGWISPLRLLAADVCSPDLSPSSPPPPPGVVPFWVTGRCRRRFRQPKGLRIPSQLLPSSNASHRATVCRPVVGARRAREQGGGAQGCRRARGSAQAAARRRYRAGGLPGTGELGLEGALVGQVPWLARPQELG